MNLLIFLNDFCGLYISEWFVHPEFIFVDKSVPHSTWTFLQFAWFRSVPVALFTCRPLTFLFFLQNVVVSHSAVTALAADLFLSERRTSVCNYLPLTVNFSSFASFKHFCRFLNCTSCHLDLYALFFTVFLCVIFESFCSACHR